MRTEINDIIDGPVELPLNDSVDTEFGPMTVQFMLDAEHQTITLDANANGAYITINGVDIAVVMRLTDYGDGFGFEPSKDGRGQIHDALYAGRRIRRGSRPADEASGAAKRKLFAVLPGVANKWAVGKDETLLLARKASAYRAIREFRSDLERAEDLVDTLKGKVEDAEHWYCSIPRPVPA